MDGLAMTEEEDSGRYYRDHWREKVMELGESTAKEVQNLAQVLGRMDERMKALERGGRWFLGIAGTVVAAGLVALLAWFMEH